MKRGYLTLICILSLLYIQPCLAQDSLDAESSVVWDPRGTSFVCQVQPYYLEYNQSNALNFGGGLRADYFLPRVLSLHGSVKQAFFDLNKYNSSKGIKNSQNDTRLFLQREIGVGLFFNYAGYAKTKAYAWPGTEFYVDPIEKDTLYDFTPQYLPARVMIGLRGGIYTWRQTIDQTSATSSLAGTDANGQQFIFPDTFDVYTTMRASGFYGGISVSKLLSVFYEASSGEQEEISFIRNVYIDVLYAPGIKVNPVLVNGVPLSVTGPGGFKTQQFGGRIIFEKIGCVDFPRLNISYRFEAGIRPGIAGKGGYVMQTIGLGFAK